MNSAASPTVTVIIATYNKRQPLQYAIESVLWQTFTDFECWVIGDACTDGSEEVVARIDDRRVHWFNLPENSGYQSAPTNEGLRRAKGKYIAYLNDDDIWLPNHLQVLVQDLEKHNADFVYSIIERFSTDLDRHVDAPNYPEAPRPPEASATLHHNSVVDNLGFWKMPMETRMNPRVEFFRTAQLSGYRFMLVPVLTVLKFGRSKDGYGKAGEQEEYMTRIRDNPDFIQNELGVLLVQAIHQLEGPISIRQLKTQFMQTIRRRLIKASIDPGHLTFWQQPGQRIKNWRKFHGLDGDAIK